MQREQTVVSAEPFPTPGLTMATMTLCTVGDCERPHKAKGMCSHHYNVSYYAARADEQRARSRRWQAANPEATAARLARRDPEKMRSYQRAYYAAHRLDCIAATANQKARRVGVPGRLTGEGLAARLAYFDGRCWVCGGEADTIDHVKPFAAGGPNFHSNIRPACLSCNTSRQDEWGGVTFL